MTAVAYRNLRIRTSSVRAPGQRPGLKVVQPMSAEIVLGIIVLFFSGVWSAIKFVDDYTDNRLVFFVPAAVLSLFLLTGIGEGFVFFAFLFAFGPIIAMLIIVGLDQGGQNSISSARTWATSSSSPSSRARPLGLAPSGPRVAPSWSDLARDSEIGFSIPQMHEHSRALCVGYGYRGDVCTLCRCALCVSAYALKHVVVG